jgi:peptidoglycan/LPS O-acetylase OafA/YrhL
MSRTSIALHDLRAVIIVLVVAFHSVLAYLTSLPAAPYAFDAEPYRWQAVPIMDSQRFFGFDLFCAWQDISLMSLLFLLAGLFVPSSLARKGSWTYLSDRFLRIGLPMVLVIAVLMPIAYYPTYRVTASDPSVSAYWEHWLALPFWPCGPQWFLWQLLALNVLAAGLHRFAPKWSESLGRLAASSREHPVRFFAGLTIASALVYVPVAAIYSPWTWTTFGPLSWQISRPLHYLVYFFAGYALGAYGLDRGLLATDGPLAQRWGVWLAASVGGFLLWAGPTSLITGGAEAEASLLVKAASGVGFAVACASGCFALLALCLRFAPERRQMLDSLSANAYSIYLVHYVFIVWLQYMLLGVALFAIGKAAIVLAGTLLLSWAATLALGSISPAALTIAAKRWLGVDAIKPMPAKLLKQDD